MITKNKAIKIFVFIASIVFSYDAQAVTYCEREYGRKTTHASTLTNTLITASGLRAGLAPLECREGGRGENEIRSVSTEKCVQYIGRFTRNSWTQANCEKECTNGFIATAQKFVNTRDSGTCLDNGGQNTYYVKLVAPEVIGYQDVVEHYSSRSDGRAFGIAKDNGYGKMQCSCAFNITFTLAPPPAKKKPIGGGGRKNR